MQLLSSKYLVWPGLNHPPVDGAYMRSLIIKLSSSKTVLIGGVESSFNFCKYLMAWLIPGIRYGRRILTCKHYLPTSASFEKRKMGCEMLFRGLTLNEGQEKAGEEASAL